MTVFRSAAQDVSRQSSADVRARRFSAGNDGTGIALALGGGFARGFAHLGVLEVLEQEEIPVSAIAGTSIGGLLGAAYADGISVRELCDIGRQVRVRDLIRFQRSSKDSPGNDRIGRFVREWFHASRVEDLCIPMAIVTTDVATSAPRIFTHGPIELAIRASCAFPGLFPPVAYEGRLLADGCIAAPVPTAIAARMNSLCVLGVEVSSNTGSSAEVSRAGQLRSPAERSWSQSADFLLEPAVQLIDWDDFESVDKARAAGAEEMRRLLPRVRELLDRRGQLCRSEEISGRMPRGMVS